MRWLSDKIIKASQITGKYKLKNISSVDNKKMSSSELQDHNIDYNSEQDKNFSGANDSGYSEDDNSNPEHNKKIKRAEKKAKNIVENAQQKAQEIIDNAEQQKEKIKDKAHKKGYDQGFAEGKKSGIQEGQQEALEKVNQCKEQLQDIVQKFKSEIEEEKQELPKKIIELALAIASKIISVKVEVNPEIINNIVWEMLDDIGVNVKEIYIKVNPQVYSYLEKDEIREIKGDFEINFQQDDSLQKGDCIIETDFGGKNGTLEEKMQIIEDELMKGISNNEFDKSG